MYKLASIKQKFRHKNYRGTQLGKSQILLLTAKLFLLQITIVGRCLLPSLISTNWPGCTHTLFNQHQLVGGYNPLCYHSLSDKEAPNSCRHQPALAPPFLPDLIIEYNENNKLIVIFYNIALDIMTAAPNSVFSISLTSLLQPHFFCFNSQTLYKLALTWTIMSFKETNLFTWHLFMEIHILSWIFTSFIFKIT